MRDRDNREKVQPEPYQNPSGKDYFTGSTKDHPDDIISHPSIRKIKRKAMRNRKPTGKFTPTVPRKKKKK
jgi:hypothetical protein